ncbi:TPA: hypothetical protein RI791_002064 [Vibrio cholerae]|nr:hypothetical protein [Vibrio cholerae]
MIQLYALMKQPLSDALAERFPNAVTLGPYHLGVFVDSELEQVTALAQSWEHFSDEAEFHGELAILTYDQAKALAASYQEPQEAI